MKKFLIAGVFAALSAALSAADYFLYNPTDLKSVSVPSGTTMIYFAAKTAEDPFTLTGDLNWSSYQTGVTAGDALLDFSNGNYTLRLKSFMVQAANTITNVIIRGGTIKLQGTSGSDFRYQYNGRFNCRNMVLDHCTVTNVSDFWGIQGANNVLILTNSAAIHAKAPRVFMSGSLSKNYYTNNLIVVSAGSSLRSESGDMELDRDKNYNDQVYSDNRLICTGHGSFLGMKPGLYSTIQIGANGPGLSVLIDDHATCGSGNIVIGGPNAYAKNNSLTVDNYACVTNLQSITMGRVAGANYNSFTLRNGADLFNGQYNDITVGEYGSYNEFNVVDATISRCRHVIAGLKPGANFNRVRFAGQNFAIGGISFSNTYFGQGEFNEYVYEDCTTGDSDTLRTYLCGSSDVSAGGTTNNTLRLERNVKFSTYDFIVNVACVSNTVFFGEDTVVNIGHDFWVHGLENVIVFSNATLKTSVSGENFRFGVTNLTQVVYPERGNRLVLQGERPLITVGGQSSSVKFDCESEIEFDLPKTGYAAPVFQKVGLWLNSNTVLRFKNLKQLKNQLVKTTDYRLTDGYNILIDGQGEDGHEQLFEDYFAAAEGLIDGCSLGMKTVINSEGKSARCLVLTVKGTCGGVLLYR